IGSRVPMYCTGSGRAYLGALPEAEALALVQQAELKMHTPYTRTTVDDIMEDLRQTRQRGYAVNGEELFLGDMTLAAPINNAGGRPIASVHIVAPTSRWTRDKAEKKLVPALLQCALSLNNIARALD
ncbi:MAG TPA: IclR family transcriptional regulator C-terminal domain-containing protein, partial [Burkholderiaceae bacterium]